MDPIRFEWDRAKAAANRRKHGVTFEEARSVFYDDEAVVIADPEHSIGEDRFVILGRSFESRILVVCHCHREDDDTIRIISARKANAREQHRYETRDFT